MDRSSGKAIFISLWESEQAMQRSDEVMRPFRAEISGTFAANRVDVEYYEVGENLVQEIRERELVEQELELSVSTTAMPNKGPLNRSTVTPHPPQLPRIPLLLDFSHLEVKG